MAFSSAQSDALQARYFTPASQGLRKMLLPQPLQTCFGALFVCLLIHSPFASADIISDARSNNNDALKAAIAAKEDVNAKQSDGTTALHWAVYNGNAELAKALIKA
ncbi:MAG TPA: ankyrin repeat domain-containing protein, partial [Candidatus Acidoferrum sp.]|nr:ankyrin repeat domain-containing protein [Candidatus Acidoferrum sp.]